MKRADAFAVLLIAHTLLTGCGFHLRGGESLGTTEILALRLDDRTRRAAHWSDDGPDALARTLREVLGESGAALATEDAPLTLVLQAEGLEKRIASISRSAGAGEYQIDYSLVWSVAGRDGAMLVKDAVARASGSYRYKADAIMGSAAEDSLILRELRRDAARQVLRQIRLARAAHARAPEQQARVDQP